MIVLGISGAVSHDPSAALFIDGELVAAAGLCSAQTGIGDAYGSWRQLLALLTGSEGMLGVIVEVTVKLLPKPERAQVLMAAFDDVVKAGEGAAAGAGE